MDGGVEGLIVYELIKHYKIQLDLGWIKKCVYDKKVHELCDSEMTF
jgi:hypothetical protein